MVRMVIIFFLTEIIIISTEVTNGNESEPKKVKIKRDHSVTLLGAGAFLHTSRW